MAIPPWTIELLRRGINDVARKASEPETLERIKSQASELLQDLPQTAARGIDAVMRGAEAGKKTFESWSRKHTALAVPMLNATGVLINESGTGVRVPDAVLEIGREFLAGDTIRSTRIGDRFERRLQKLLPSGEGHTILLTSSFSSALTAFSLLASEQQLVVHRAHSVRLQDGRPLPDALGALLPVIQEVGGIDGVHISDFDALDRFCAVLADDGLAEVATLDFGSTRGSQAVILPVATLTACQPAAPAADGNERTCMIPSASAMLAAGADFVIMPGDGVCGGPDCGIIVGRTAELHRIRQSGVWPSLKASDAVTAMMLVALETAASNADLIPVQALINTGEENLRARAERLATRLSGSDRIKSCQVTAEDARLTERGRWKLASRQLRIRHATWNADQWSSKLLEELPAVIAQVDQEELCIDLRWIDAAHDAALGEILGGKIH